MEEFAILAEIPWYQLIKVCNIVLYEHYNLDTFFIGPLIDPYDWLVNGELKMVFIKAQNASLHSFLCVFVRVLKVYVNCRLE